MSFFYKRYGILLVSTAILLSGCAGHNSINRGSRGVEPLITYPVTDNRTPYSSCLEQLGRIKGVRRFPAISVGAVLDKTGTYEEDGLSRELSQGATEMVISALYKTGKVALQERWDLRVPLAEMKLAQGGMLKGRNPKQYNIRASDYVLVGAITELNYNIASGGAAVGVSGIGIDGRSLVLNVALDLRVVNPVTFEVPYVASLQKQIVGTEVSANVFRFFGNELVEFEAGSVQNEPIQLGVRSVIEMAVYQIMTDFLRLPQSKECHLQDENFSYDLVKDGPSRKRLGPGNRTRPKSVNP